MTRTATEVLIGTGTLYVGPLGTVQPASPAAVPDAAFKEIGFSEEGWVFAVSREFAKLVPAETVDPIKILQTSRELHMRGNLWQASFDNLKLALGGGTVTTVAAAGAVPEYKKFVPVDATDAAPTYYTLLFRSPGTEVGGVSQVRELYIPLCTSVGAVELPARKAPAVSTLAIDFELQKPDAGPIFEMRELTGVV